MDCSGNFIMEIDKLFPNSILKALESIGIYIEMTCNEYEKKFSTMQFFARCSSSPEKLLLFKWFNLIGIKTFKRKREREWKINQKKLMQLNHSIRQEYGFLKLLLVFW